MFEFLKRMFRKAPEREPGLIPEELWTSELDQPASGRFLPVSEDRYRASYRKDGGFELTLFRKNLFAWAEAPEPRHEDLALEAQIEFTGGEGLGAAGFLLRAEGDRDFLYVLVSNRGFLRVDAVFNGKPHPVVPWTECPEPVGPSFNLKIVLSGSLLVAAVDDLWTAECEDETVRQGRLAFAAQNYDEAREASCVLRFILTETRPLEVEARRLRWSVLEKADPGQRVRLARSLAAGGLDVPALVQLRKAEKSRPLDADGLFLRAECSLRLGLLEDAETALRACLAASGEAPEERTRLAREELANLLYLRGNYLELRDELAGRDLSASPRLAGLLGHAYWNLGNWGEAADCYGRAARAEPDMPIFALNEARSWDQAGRREEAAEAYERAARGFLAQESPEDLEECLGRLKALRPRSDATAALAAKMLFRDGKKAEAEKVFRKLAAKGTEDSAVLYLLGLILSERGERAEAVGHLRKACALESGFSLYWFRLAEALFLSGDAEGAAEPWARARDLAPGDGWILNLGGLLAERRGDSGEAIRCFRSARERLPDQVEPAVNLSEALDAAGSTAEALEILSGFPDSPSARNQAGNILARRGRLEEAAAEYDRAVRAAAGTASPEIEAEYRANYAACCLELDRYSDAEDQLRRALQRSPSRRVYLLTGDLAARYGDRYRAETAWMAGLELFPGDPDLLERLFRHRLYRGALGEAEQTARELERADPARGERARAELRDATTVRYECASCGREWRAPKDLPARAARTIRAQPPDDSPAGACPDCGKVYCVGCRKDHLEDLRFTCPDCGTFLKLSDDRLRHLVLESLGGKRKGSRGA